MVLIKRRQTKFALRASEGFCSVDSLFLDEHRQQRIALIARDAYPSWEETIARVRQLGLSRTIASDARARIYAITTRPV